MSFVSNLGVGGNTYESTVVATVHHPVSQISFGAGGTLVTASVGLPVQVLSVIPGVGATSLGKAEDAAHTTGDTGVPMWAVRRDAAAVGSSTDGDYSTLNVDASGLLWVNVGNGALRVQGFADHDDLATDWPVRIAGRASLTVPTAVATGDVCNWWLTREGMGNIVLRDSVGDSCMDDALNALQVKIVSGAGGTEYTVDVAAPAAPTGGTFVMERDDALSVLTEIEGDWTNPRSNNAGALWVAIYSGTVDIASAANSDPDSFHVSVHGASNHDAVHDNRGVPLAGYAKAAAPANVSADGDHTNLWCLLNGSLVVNVAAGGALMPGDATDGFYVQIKGTQATNINNMANSLASLDDLVFTDDATFTPGAGGSKVMPVGFFADETATDSVDEGKIGIGRMTLDRKQITTLQPHTKGGLSIFRSLDLDETEEEVKATAGQVYGGWVTNRATTTRWFKFYNATAANVTVGTTTPLITIGIPGNATDNIAGILGISGGLGIEFDTAITVAVTTGFADADVGAPGANDFICNLFYK